MVEHPGQGIALGGSDLHASVVVLDQLLDIFDQDGSAGAVGAFGVPAGAHEVAVDVAVAILGVGDDQLRSALFAMEGAFEVVTGPGWL